MKEHPASLVVLQSAERFVPSSPLPSVRRQLENAVRSQQFWNCPTCGGLLPDLEVYDRDRSYRFTCTHVVEENGNVIMQTDYSQLLLHLLAERFAKEKLCSKEDLSLPLKDFIKKLSKEKKNANEETTQS